MLFVNAKFMVKFGAFELVQLKRYSRTLVLHFHKVGGLIRDLRANKRSKSMQDPTFPIMQPDSIFLFSPCCLVNVNIFVTQAFCYSCKVSKPELEMTSSGLFFRFRDVLKTF